MQFDRWQYDPEKNRFRHRPVTAVISTIQDHNYACALLEAHLAHYTRLVRQVARLYEARLWELQRRIDDLRDE